MELHTQIAEYGANSVESEFNGKAGYTDLAALDQTLANGFNEWLDAVKASDVADQVKIPLAINSKARFEHGFGIQSVRELVSNALGTFGQAHEAKSNKKARQDIADLAKYAQLDASIA